MQRMGIIITALALSACATDPGASQTASLDRECFSSSQVRGYSVIDRNHVGISVGASDQYVLTTLWNAYDLDWTQAIALRTSTGRICTGNGLGVDIIGGDPQRTYPITSIERAPETPAQAS